MANPIDKGLVISVGFDDSVFASGMKGINQKLKQAQNEFKTLNAVIGKSGNSVKELSIRYQSATKVFEAQKAKVEALKQQMLKTKEAVENNTKATQKDKDALLRQTQAYNNAVGQLAKYEGQMKSLQSQVIKTGGYIGKFGTAIQTAGSKIKSFSEGIKGVGDKVSDVGGKMTAFASVPVAGAMAGAAKTAIGFRDEMTKMQAVSDASTKDMKKLEQASISAAKEYGVSTESYNAAATELLKSGYSAKESVEIMNAGIKTSKATGEDLETVLDKTSNTMKIFGFEAKDASKVTDKLAYVANASKTSVEELGDGLTKVGPVANSLGIDLDTTSSALGVLQDRGFKVEEAATGLKSGLSNLVNPSKANAAAFEKLGINMKDVKKNGVNLPKILDNMAKATNGMTDAQKEAYISAAFGKESMAQWTALMEGDAQKALAEYTKGSKDATGSVDKLWEKMKESPQQKIDELKGSFEAMAINFGDKVLPVVLPALTKITDKINDLVDWFDSLDEGTQNNIVKWGLLAVAAGPVVIALGKVTRGVGSVVTGFSNVVTGMGKFITKSGEFVTKTKEGTNWVGKLGTKLKNAFTVETNNDLNKAKLKIKDIGDEAKLTSDKVWKIGEKAKGVDSKEARSSMTVLKDDLEAVRKKASSTSSAVSAVYTSAEGPTTTGNNSKGSKGKKGKRKLNTGKIASTAFTAMYFVDIIGSLAELAGVSASVVETIGGISGVLATIGTVASGPVGIAILAIGGISLALYEAYKHCEDFKDSVDAIPAAFNRSFSEGLTETRKFVNEWVPMWDGSFIKINSYIDNWALAFKFNKKLDQAKKEGKSFWETLGGMWDEWTKKLSTKIENWPIVGVFYKKFRAKDGSAKSQVDRFASVTKGTVTDWTKKVSDTISKSEIDKKTEEKAKASNNAINRALKNTGLSSAELIDKLGGNGGDLKSFEPIKYAKGTGSGGHPGGLATINDGNGPHWKEIVVSPSGQASVISQRNWTGFLPKGTQVIPGRQSHEILSGKVPAYKDGVGFLGKAWDFGKKVFKNIGSTMSSLIGNVEDWLDKPKELVNKVIDTFVGKFKTSGNDYTTEVARNAVNKSKVSLVERVQELMSSMFAGGDESGAHGDLGSNNWFKVDGNWVREWQYRLLEPLIKQYKFIVADGGRRTWDNYDHSKGRAMDIAIPGNPLGTYWKVAQKINNMPFVKYVNSNMKSTINGSWQASNLEPSPNHIHVSFTKELLSKNELKATDGADVAVGKGILANPKGSGVRRWIPIIKAAAKRMKVNLTTAGLNAILRRIRQESNGDPYITNNWDSNAMAGHPSKGLLQYIQPTLNTWVPKGVKPVLSNGYTQLLAMFNDSNWLRDISVSGGWGPTGRKRFEKGGLITSHTIAEMGEGGKPEMVIPLTNKARSVQLINKAQKLIGEDTVETDTSELDRQNSKLDKLIDGIDQAVELLSALLVKDTSIYINDREIAKATANANQQEIARLNNNSQRLRGGLI